MRAAFCVILCTPITVVFSRAASQTSDPPVLLGTLAGEAAPSTAQGVKLYGTDLGWTFVHDSQLYILFGDSWREENSVCSIAKGALPINDDVQATLPMTPPSESGPVPQLSIVTDPRAPQAFRAITVLRDGASLDMGLNRTPLAGFSDGEHAVAVFESATFLRCTQSTAEARSTCPQPFTCESKIGVCLPTLLGIPQLCDVQTNAGCLTGQLCALDGPGYCIDPSSTQPQLENQVPLEVEFSIPREGDPASWDSKLTFATNKFYNMTARTVSNLSDAAAQSDYRPGAHTLLIWGRPGFSSGPGLDTGLYLMAHSLPFQEDAAGKWIFEPRYFAGVDARNNPRWTERQEDAEPLALDGEIDGDPTEVVTPVKQLTVSWLDAPINKWVMFYGGGQNVWLPDLSNKTSQLDGIVLRFADHPWGPWTPPQLHWFAGTPDTLDTPRGPGGVLFDPRCVSKEAHPCAQSDPSRPAHVFNKDCEPPLQETDFGHLYAPNIIDAYAQPSADGGLDVYWNVSTWNPYRVLLLRSRFHPESAE